MQEQAIIQGCKHNDRKCQRAFVDQYSPYLYGVCRRYVKEQAIAQDCLQDALVQILQNINQYDATGSFKAWAARVTATQCLQRLRKEKRHLNVGLENSVEPQVDEKISTKLEVQDLMKFLDTLPDSYRIAVCMYVIEGYSHREIGEALGITESSSRSLVSRARKMIGDHFQKEVEKSSKKKKSEATLTTIKKITKLA